MKIKEAGSNDSAFFYKMVQFWTVQFMSMPEHFLPDLSAPPLLSYPLYNPL